jgi:hypothetical protein
MWVAMESVLSSRVLADSTNTRTNIRNRVHLDTVYRRPGRILSSSVFIDSVPQQVSICDRIMRTVTMIHTVCLYVDPLFRSEEKACGSTPRNDVQWRDKCYYK